jgi:hypothetical protein
VQRHDTQIELVEPAPPEIDAGTRFAVQAMVSCPHGCDLRGRRVSVGSDNEVLAAGELSLHADRRNTTEPIELKAPDQPGDWVWAVTFAQIDDEQVVHHSSSVSLTIRTRPHPTSLAVWDLPSSPVAVNGSFTVKVGVKCAAGCPMAGRSVDVLDEAGLQVGDGRLSDTPWPETSGLFWAEVRVQAPAVEAVTTWSARFAAAACELPHDEASAHFSVRVAKPPEHRVAISLITQDSQAPVADAEMRLGPYIGNTDEAGEVTLELPAGAYELRVRSDGYEVQPFTVDVQRDLNLRVEAHKTLTKAEWEERLAEFKDLPWG